MSPFSKVEMSPFVILKWELQDERDGRVTLLAMSQPELTRLEVIQRVKRKTLRQRQAAELLSISPDGMDIRFLNQQATDYVLWTLPEDIRDSVRDGIKDNAFGGAMKHAPWQRSAQQLVRLTARSKPGCFSVVPVSWSSY